MSDKQQEMLVSASRVLSAISGILSPIILIVAVGLYNKMDSYGNRITSLEVRMAQQETNQNKIETTVTALQKSYYDIIIKQGISSNP